MHWVDSVDDAVVDEAVTLQVTMDSHDKVGFPYTKNKHTRALLTSTYYFLQQFLIQLKNCKLLSNL